MTPIEKVLKALKEGGMAKAKLLGKEYNPFDCEIQKSISELEGKTIVPIEMDEIQKKTLVSYMQNVGLSCNYTWFDYIDDIHKAMIAPYLPEVEND